jgi:hypothetical protein
MSNTNCTTFGAPTLVDIDQVDDLEIIWPFQPAFDDDTVIDVRVPDFDE